MVWHYPAARSVLTVHVVFPRKLVDLTGVVSERYSVALQPFEVEHHLLGDGRPQLVVLTAELVQPSGGLSPVTEVLSAIVEQRLEVRLPVEVLTSCIVPAHRSSPPSVRGVVDEHYLSALGRR